MAQPSHYHADGAESLFSSVDRYVHTAFAWNRLSQYICNVIFNNAADMKPSILLIGHRATGKSTLGRLLAQNMGCAFHDIDDIIAERSGRTPAQLISEDEASFRDMERDVLRELRQESGRSVIAAGAGLQDFSTGLFVIWLFREGWGEDAIRSRERLRPEIPAEEEIEWMQQTREPAYTSAAHIRLHIEFGCTIEQAATRLKLYVHWLDQSVGSRIMRLSWMSPRDRADLDRCIDTARLFDMAGVEIRSDIFDALPDTDVPLLAALRTDNPDFLAGATRAAAFDCDAYHIQHLHISSMTPRPLILSIHPDDVQRDFFEYLLELRQYVSRLHNEWAEHILLKYAPRVGTWVDLRYANQLYKVMEKQGDRLSFFPRGRRWKWMRIQRLFSGNQLNYISSGCEEHSQLPPSVDFFLPHCHAAVQSALYGVIGADVEHSIGDRFHGACAYTTGSAESYVNIPLAASEIDNCLHLLPQIGFKGLSITSPLKAAIAESNFVGTEQPIEAGNTLSLVKGSFLLYDTDEEGMLAALEEIESRGIRPGATIIFGDGGVSPALQRALRRRSWSPVKVLSARDGWKCEATTRVVLIVNASGRAAFEHAPACEAWLELRYRNLQAIASTAHLYFNGMTFYKHQAMAQRRLWELPLSDDMLTSW
jgi:shikimate kinase